MDTDLHLELLTLAISKLHSRSRSLIHRLGNVNQPFLYTKFPQGPPQNHPSTLSNAFSRSTKAIHKSFFFSINFSCTCLTTNIASTVPLPPVKPNCISSTFT